MKDHLTSDFVVRSDSPALSEEGSRGAHLAWCKKRALEYVDHGNAMEGLTSMFSDLEKHPGTQGHAGIQMGVMMMMGGMLSSPAEARRFIEGFN